MADSYQNAPWVKDLYEEFWSSSTAEWSPYVYFRRRPFDGRYINIDGNGFRRTANNAASAPKRLFMFGGSTVWGTGVGDEFTIPSLLVTELRRRGIEAQITNFGESGYVTTQEVITLLLQLRDGNVPDAVIFYDGVNDIYAAYQSGSAGIPQNETNRVARDILARLGISQVTAATEPRAARNGITARQLAENVLHSYQGNLGIVNGLAERFGFKAWFLSSRFIQHGQQHVGSTMQVVVRQGRVNLQHHARPPERMRVG